MPQESQLDPSKKFEDQRDLVIKTIIPTIMEIINLDVYPVSETVIYEMLHQRHRHKREDERIKKKSEPERKKEAKRKHINSRRLEVIKISQASYNTPSMIYRYHLSQMGGVNHLCKIIFSVTCQLLIEEGALYPVIYYFHK